MELYSHSPSDDRQAWFDLTCDLGRGMEQLGWGVYNHLPEPLTPDMWRAVRYHDRWKMFAFQFRESVAPAIEEWCFSGEWPEMANGTCYLLQLRSYITIRAVESLYAGPGKYGETFVPFPRHVMPPNLRRWWLSEWFDSKGEDLLFREMTLRFWTKRKSMFSPLARKQMNLKSGEWEAPKYRPYFEA